MFLWLTDPTFGLFNEVLHWFGSARSSSFASTKEALFVIVVMRLGLARVRRGHLSRRAPRRAARAARGGGDRRREPVEYVPERHVPLLGPATLFLAIWLSINALQLFAEVYLTTKGGPLFATTVIVYYLFHNVRAVRRRTRCGSGLGLYLWDLVFSLVELWIGKRKVHYNS